MSPIAKRVVVIASFAESLILFRGPLLRRMAGAGHDVLALAPASEPVARELAAMGIQFEAIPLDRTGLNPARDLGLVLGLVRRLRRHGPDCVLSYTIKPVVYGSIASAICRVPMVALMITGLGFAFTEGGGGRRRLARWIAQALYGVALQFADVVFFQNPDDRDDFSRRGLTGPGKVVMINGSGVDLDHYAERPLPDQVGFLMIARLVRDKGVIEYVEAARILRREFPWVRCVLAGWLDSNPSAVGAAQVEAWCREGVIDYVGPLADVRPTISGCSVYVLPSYREGTPRTVLEAMAMGRAIVTTDVPGCRETIVDGESGFLVPPRDPEALAAAMSRFLGDPALARRMGADARRRVEQVYDVHKVNEVVMDALGLQ